MICEGNKAEYAERGVQLGGGGASNECKVVDNTITDGTYGVHITPNSSSTVCEDHLVANNQLYRLTNEGVYINNQAHATVRGNGLEDVGTGGTRGIYAFDPSKPCDIIDNRVINPGGGSQTGIEHRDDGTSELYVEIQGNKVENPGFHAIIVQSAAHVTEHLRWW